MDVIRETGYGFLPTGVVASRDKLSCVPKSIFPVDCRCEKDVCKTVDRSLQTADELKYDSLYSEFLSHKGFVFVKLSASRVELF